MNAFAIHTDINKALALVAKKHGISIDTKVTARSEEYVALSISAGKSLTDDQVAYMNHKTPKTESGHNLAKRLFPGLHDDMKGRRFTMDGKQFVYVGYATSRPAYPVSMLQCERNGSYSPRKAPKHYLERMIAQFAPILARKEDQRISEALKKSDPSLADGGLF